MLTIAEELVLLILDDEKGTMLAVPQQTLDYALAGAVLMDLALLDRLDSDPEMIWITNRDPTGDPMLDELLEEFPGEARNSCPGAVGACWPASEWIQRLAEEPGRIHEMVLRRLVERRVLRKEESRFLWVFETRRYPLIDDKEQRDIKLRIMGVLFSEEIPDPREIAIISLVDACNLFEDLLSRRELERARNRIALVRRLDLIGQATLREIERAITQVLTIMH